MRRAKAIASCKRALALNPVLLAVQQSQSRLLFDTEQFEQAEASYRRRAFQVRRLVARAKLTARFSSVMQPGIAEAVWPGVCNGDAALARPPEIARLQETEESRRIVPFRFQTMSSEVLREVICATTNR